MFFFVTVKERDPDNLRGDNGRGQGPDDELCPERMISTKIP